MLTFVGDVHGWSDRLDAVLEQAEGELVFVGDLVDRGPDSAGVVRRVRQLCDLGRARCIMGNHEYALVRGLGVPELGIAAVPALYTAWRAFYGGIQTLASYGVDDDPEALRRALGEDLPWLASLPWVLQGACDGRRWIAVHAGLDENDLQPQLDALRAPEEWWHPDADLPGLLYRKDLVETVPHDLPDDSCVVSGHTPLVDVLLTRARICCDTSGGMPGLPLSAVVWPSGRVVASSFAEQ